MPYQVTSRQAIVFVAGLALGIAGAWALFGKHSGATEQAGHKQSAAAATRTMGAAPVSVAVGACDFKPVVSTAASDDGRVNVQTELSGRGPKEIESWLLDGKEAVAAGRQRDAEADFLMACRAAEQLGDGGVLPQAEAMYHLGRHYAQLAGAAPESGSGELWKRAGSLFAASLKAFDARYGNDSDKTRFAAKGLADVQAHNGGATIVAAGNASAPAKATKVEVAKVVPPAAVKVEPARQEVHAAAPVVETKPAPFAKAAPEPKPAPETKVVAAPKPVPDTKIVAVPKPMPETKVVVVPKPMPEPKVVAQPKAAPEPKVAAAKPVAPKPAEPSVAAVPPTPHKAPEHAVAVARPTPPAPRPAMPAAEATGEATGQATATIMEPPARAAGSARAEPVQGSN